MQMQTICLVNSMSCGVKCIVLCLPEMVVAEEMPLLDIESTVVKPLPDHLAKCGPDIQIFTL